MTTTPWQTLGVPAGMVVNPDGSRNAYVVRWDLTTNAPGMGGTTSVSRRFATAGDAIAAVAAGMGRAYAATAMDGTRGHAQLAARRNPCHWRNRRGSRRAL